MKIAPSNSRPADGNGIPVSSLKALIFDVDGTLADTERDGHRVAYNRAFAEAGLGWHWDVETYGRLLDVTGGKERLRFHLDHHCSGFRPPTEADRFINRLYASKTAHYFDILRSGAIPLRPGVARLIREARAAGVRLGIATTSGPESVSELLRVCLGEESPGWFDAFAAGDMVGRKKPAPDVYLLALEQLKLPPEACLAVEDSRHGLSAAVAAGLKTIVTLNRYTAQQDFGGAMAVVEEIGETGPVTLDWLIRSFNRH